MATAWQALGSQVTLIERGERLLPPLEPAAGEAVAAALREPGVDVRLGTGVTAARREGTEVVADDARDGEVRGDEVLVAVGRRARTTRHRRRHRRAWSRASTSTSTTRCRCAALPWLYGVGDVNGRRQLTHMGKYQARQAGAAIVARATGEQVVDGGLVAVRRHRRPRRDAVRRLHRSRRSRASGCTVGRGGGGGPAAPRRRVPDRHVAGVVAVRRRLHRDGDRGRRHRARGAARRDVRRARPSPSCCRRRPSPSSGRCRSARLWHAVPAYPTINEIWLRLLETYRG